MLAMGVWQLRHERSSGSSAVQENLSAAGQRPPNPLLMGRELASSPLSEKPPPAVGL